MPYIESIEEINVNIQNNFKNGNMCDSILPEEHCKKETKPEIKEVEDPGVKEKNMSCVCNINDQPPYIYTFEDYEQKRLELINLQKTIVQLRHSKQKKIKSEAKLLKLSVDSRFYFSYPDIDLNFETLQKIKFENESVKSEIDYLCKGSIDESVSEFHQSQQERISQIFRNANEKFYKMFVGRVGHLCGENRSVFIVLSSETLYIINKESNRIINEVLYEKIEEIIIGGSERWFSIRSRNLETNNFSHFQIDVGDSSTTFDIIKYLEVAIRRRILAFSSILRKRSIESLNSSHINRFVTPLCAKKNKCFSVGGWVQSLLPVVVSSAVEEMGYIENWLMSQLKVKERPRVLACWLVFWESGSEIWCDKREDETVAGPCYDGFLMTNNTPQNNAWKPAYFLLKGGFLYQFREPCDRLPRLVIRVRNFCGCRRLPSDARPHAFELLSSDGPSMCFAAPNEETASNWLQAFLRVLSMGDDFYHETRRLRPCQVIQTTESLILSYQSDISSLLKPPPPTAIPPHKDPRLLNLNALRNEERKPRPLKVELSRSSSKGMMIASTPKKAGSKVASVPLSCPTAVECPPTPPPFMDSERQQAKDSPPLHSEDSLDSPTLQLLAFCNLNQVSEIFITSGSSTGCLMEFDCSEASEIAGDWALYFQSEEQLGSFLGSVLEGRENVTGQLMGLTKASNGRVHDLLLEGSVLSKSSWGL